MKKYFALVICTLILFAFIERNNEQTPKTRKLVDTVGFASNANQMNAFMNKIFTIQKSLIEQNKKKVN